jgi:hypothetical protein
MVGDIDAVQRLFLPPISQTLNLEDFNKRAPLKRIGSSTLFKIYEKSLECTAA